MWQAISYVTSGLTLLAFAYSVIAWIYKTKSEERERLIRIAKEEQRAELVRNALEFFHVETKGLTKEQQYNLALEQIQSRAQRFRITAAVVCFIALITAIITAFAISKVGKPAIKPATAATTVATGKFTINDCDIQFIRLGDKIRTEVSLRAIPITKNNDEVATILTGMVVLHNEELVDLSQKGPETSLTCGETKSCLGVKLFDNLEEKPLIIRGGDLPPTTITAVFNIPLSVKVVRVYWEFYQKEAGENKLCVIDESKQPPKEGIPFLKVVTRGGEKTDDHCWRACGKKIIRVAL